jgi:hypothetical protein
MIFILNYLLYQLRYKAQKFIIYFVRFEPRFLLGP